jgi:N-acetylglutamate synthase-like GNAT family acetyltransferase/2-polyprenyl-3-methyl-5-hydroxy-6-metoxy-1,4-benzoquinol methylase
MADSADRGGEIKQAVRERYAKAVTTPGGSCCGEASVPQPKGTLARIAGYSAAELAALPSGAVENAFGCGNPLAFAGVRPGHVVLDLGSGAGIDCLLAAQRVGPTGRVIGLDMTPEMIAKAEANAREAGATNVEFRLGEMEKMPVADASVDWVISNCVICLSPDKDAVFREMARVLKPGGQASVSDIVAEELPRIVQRDMAAWTSCVGGAIPEREYLAKMEAAGLANARVEARIVYERSQVERFIEGAIAKLNADPATAAALRGEVDRLTGKIWSAKVRAERPVVAAAGRRVAIRGATVADLPRIEELLHEGSLPSDGIAAHLPDFFVAEAGGEVIGVIGMERYGREALFRSLAVASWQRGRGIAKALMDVLVGRAKAAGVERAYALTLTIPDLLQRWGFAAIAREAAPAAIRGTTEFTGCCSSAPLFVLDLTGAARPAPVAVAAPGESRSCCG